MLFHQCHALGALVVSEREWKVINNNIEQIKAVHFGNSQLEIHTREIYHRTKRFIHFTEPQSKAVLGDIYSLIANSNLVLLFVAIDKFKLPRNDPTNDPEYLTWKFLLERINICLDRLCDISQMDEYGLIIMDEKDLPKDYQIRNYIKFMREKGTGFQIITRTIEDPVFTPSEWRNLIQLADAVAYCSKGYLKQDAFMTKMFLTIHDKFDHSRSGDIIGYGFKVYP